MLICVHASVFLFKVNWRPYQKQAISLEKVAMCKFPDEPKVIKVTQVYLLQTNELTKQRDCDK